MKQSLLEMINIWTKPSEGYSTANTTNHFPALQVVSCLTNTVTSTLCMSKKKKKKVFHTARFFAWLHINKHLGWMTHFHVTSLCQLNLGRTTVACIAAYLPSCAEVKPKMAWYWIRRMEPLERNNSYGVPCSADSRKMTNCKPQIVQRVCGLLENWSN